MTACLLEKRGILGIGGEDRRDFLQGLVSNDMALCLPGKPLYAALLTPQGKFLHDMFILDAGDHFLIDCEKDRAEDLLKRLKAHKLRAKVTLENVSAEYDVWAAWGADIPFFEGWFIDPRLPALGARAVLKQSVEPIFRQRADFDAYDRHRIELGVPDGSRDMEIGKATLLECNLDKLNAISWSKGCYMGQELTARMYYRALVKKRLFPVNIEGAMPGAGTPVLFDGAEIGEMRSHCGGVGLALLNIEKAKAGGTFTCGEGRLKPYVPEWLQIN